MNPSRKWEPLMAADAGAVHARAADLEPAETTWLRFLCIDDLASSREWMRRAFAQFDDQGQELVFAGSIDQAILALRTSSFDAVLLSVDMRGIRDLARVIRVIGGANRLPLIAYGKSTPDELCSLCIGAGAEDCIPTSVLSGIGFARAVHRNLERAYRRGDPLPAAANESQPTAAALMSGFNDPIFIARHDGEILSLTPQGAALMQIAGSSMIDPSLLTDGGRFAGSRLGFTGEFATILFTSWTVVWSGQPAFLVLPAYSAAH